jgi:hypothetical protein
MRFHGGRVRLGVGESLPWMIRSTSAGATATRSAPPDDKGDVGNGSIGRLETSDFDGFQIAARRAAEEPLGRPSWVFPLLDHHGPRRQRHFAVALIHDL